MHVCDTVLAVDAQNIAGLPTDTVRGLILGPPGSDVGLTIRRGAAAAAAAGVGGGGDVRLVTLRRSAIAPAAAPPDPYDPYGDGGFGDAGLDPPPPRLKPGWLGKELGTGKPRWWRSRRRARSRPPPPRRGSWMPCVPAGPGQPDFLPERERSVGPAAGPVDSTTTPWTLPGPGPAPARASPAPLVRGRGGGAAAGR